MFESIIVWIVIAGSALYLGRKFWRQWRAATDKNSQIACCGGCCSCSTDRSTCDPQQSIVKQK
jgi:hypothetical protein